MQSEGWVTGQTFDLFLGSHDGYRPVIHRRWVFSLKSRFWVVRDLVVGEGEHVLDLFWHLDPELSGLDEVFVHDGGREGPTDYRRRRA